MEVFLIYITAILINIIGIFGVWCAEPEGKSGMIMTFLSMFIPGINWIPAIIYIIFTVFMMFSPAPVFKKCTNFWKFLFGEKSIY